MDDHEEPADGAMSNASSSVLRESVTVPRASGSKRNTPEPSFAPNKKLKLAYSKVKEKFTATKQSAAGGASEGSKGSRDRSMAASQAPTPSPLHGSTEHYTGDPMEVDESPHPQGTTSVGSKTFGRSSGQHGDWTLPQMDDWVLDQEFLQSLATWDRQNPQSTLSKILNKVNETIKKGRPFFDIIPDAPFPARSLVIGLSQILQLGATLTDSDKKLRDFVLGVVDWISSLEDRMASLGSDAFAKVSWGDLAKVRKIVVKLCDWAKARLNDNRWTRLEMESEIQEFEVLVEKARQSFIDLTLLTISGNISKVKALLTEIQNARTAHEIKIEEERQRREALHRELDPHTVDRPTYDVQAKYPCEAGSRVQVLAEIRSWIHDHSTSSRNFLWLTGDPGCGKSAVTASIAQESKDQKFLWAQFFINRNVKETTNPNVYFPTIARQLADTSVWVERHIYDVVMEARSLLDQISPSQASNLFVSAISHASKARPNEPVLVVIDGLDETDNTCLPETATIFSQLFDRLSDYPNAKILISSRTEHEIYKPFTRTLTNEHVQRVHLDTQSPSCLADVACYLRNQLTKVALKHDLDREIWPGADLETELIDRAGGLYIWAVTAIKFLDSRFRKEGKENIYGIFQWLRLPPKADINVLYSQILQVIYDNDEDETTDWDLEVFRRIIGSIVMLREPFCVSRLRDLMDLRRDPSSPHGVDVRNFVQLLRTLLVSGLDDVNDDTVIRLHKSFVEYITTRTDDRFRVIAESANAEMTLCCLQHLANSYDVVTSAQFATQPSDVKSLSHSTRYALRYCLSHMPCGRSLILDDPLQALPLIGSTMNLVPPSPDALPLILSYQADPLIVTTSLHSHSLLWNFNDGSSTTPTFIDIPAYQYAMSRDGRFFVASGTLVSNWVDTQTFKVTKSLSLSGSDGFPLSGDGSLYVSEELNPDSDTLTDSRICIWWNAHTLEEIHKYHSGEGQTVVISPDSNHIIASHSDNIEIWNVREKRVVRSIYTKTRRYRPHICLSPDSKQILHADLDDNLVLWDFYTCKQIGTPFAGHTDHILSISFSPDSKYIVSSSRDGTVRLWDTATHMEVGDAWLKGLGSIFATFSPDGSYVLTVSLEEFWMFEVPSGQCLMRLPKSHGFGPVAAFSADGQQILITCGKPTKVLGDHGISVHNISPHLLDRRNTINIKRNAISTPRGHLTISMDFDHSLFLTKLESMRFGGRLLPRNNPNVPIRAVNFSPNEQRILAICTDGTLLLWDAEDLKLAGTYKHDLRQGQPIPSFSEDSNNIIVTMDTGKYYLTLVNGRLTRYRPTTAIQQSLIAIQDPTAKPHIYRDPPNRRLENIRWYPSRDPSGDSDVLWACINNTIIRAGRDGKFIIVPVAGHR